MSNRAETRHIGQTHGHMLRRSPFARWVPVLGLAVGGLAAMTVFRAPAWLIEQLVIEARLGDYIPAAQPPLGPNARMALALSIGIASTACTWLTLKWLFVPKIRPKWPVATAATSMARDLHIADEPPAILKEKQQMGTSGMMGLLRRRKPATQALAEDLPEEMPMRRRRPILSASELGPPLDDIDPHGRDAWCPTEAAPPESTPPQNNPTDFAAPEPDCTMFDTHRRAESNEHVLDLGTMMMPMDIEPATQLVEKMTESRVESLPDPLDIYAPLAIIAPEETLVVSPPTPMAAPLAHIPQGRLDAANMPLDELIAGLELRLKGRCAPNRPHISPPAAVDMSAAKGWRQESLIDRYDAIASRRFAAG